MRAEYGDTGLDEADAATDPWIQWRRWFEDAVAAGLHEPNAMIVATVDADGLPSARTVLLKGVTADGFRFFTNTESRKGEALAARPACALLFPWHPLERQVRVEGVAERLSQADVEAYFASRPRGSQLGAWASRQSRVVAGRDELAVAYREVEERFEGRDVPVPTDWGGYVVRPRSFEFWQGRRGRLHDRLRYAEADSGWTIERLAP
ncbi:hypothetical protein ASE01_01265 [Nocardioides sp. Root190]|nr:hypothetical protein ASE01_01265 [Nocardioides sp. Root190]